MSSDTSKKNKEKSETTSDAKSPTKSETSNDNSSSPSTGSNKSPTPVRATSYFSSVSSDEYREGWDTIFGTAKLKIHKPAKSYAGANSKVKLPFSVRLSNEDLNGELRDLLKDALLRQAKKDNLRIGRLLNNSRITWHLKCEIGE